MRQGGYRRDSVLAAGRGFLTGKYRTEADLGKSPRGAGVKKYLNDKGLAVLKALDAAAKKHNATTSPWRSPG